MYFEYEKLFEEFLAYRSVLLRLAINLRTVRVTAAVYWRFQQNAMHIPLLCTRRRAGVRLYTSFDDFAKPCVFVKQSLLPIFYAHQILTKFNGLASSKVTLEFCRVPFLWLSRGLSDFHLFTCVGLSTVSL